MKPAYLLMWVPFRRADRRAVTPATAARVTEEAQRRQVSISTLLRGYIADGLDGSEK